MIKKYYKPDSFLEAASLKRQYGNSARYLSGGTKLNYGSMADEVEVVISLENLPIRVTRFDRDGVSIGGMVTLQSIAGDDKFPMPIRVAAKNSFPRNIRNISTIGGNVGAVESNTSILPCLVALKAELETAERGKITIEDYLAGDCQNLILHVVLPHIKGACTIKKVVRSAGALSVINVATRLVLKKERVDEVTIAVSGIAPRVIRLRDIEDDLLSGKLKIQPEMEKQMTLSIKPETDLTGSREYKKYITGVTVADCLMACRQGKMETV
jgi:putative selenate reductase FAD-binding subunit